MPNHVANRITSNKETLDEIISIGDDAKEEVDFNKIIPTPKEIGKRYAVKSDVEMIAKISMGLIDFNLQPVDRTRLFRDGKYRELTDVLSKDNAIRLYLLKNHMANDLNDEEFEIFIEYMRAYRKLGCMNWYDWNIKNWGTKWNAYSFKRLNERQIYFETAWSAPFPVIDKLHELTQKHIIHEWADEDVGSNVGRREYKKGGRIRMFHEDFSNKKEGYELAFELMPEYKENYVFDGEKYIYDED